MLDDCLTIIENSSTPYTVRLTLKVQPISPAVCYTAIILNV